VVKSNGCFICHSSSSGLFSNFSHIRQSSHAPASLPIPFPSLPPAPPPAPPPAKDVYTTDYPISYQPKAWSCLAEGFLLSTMSSHNGPNNQSDSVKDGGKERLQLGRCTPHVSPKLSRLWFLRTRISTYIKLNSFLDKPEMFERGLRYLLKDIQIRRRPGPKLQNEKNCRFKNCLKHGICQFGAPLPV